MARSGRGWVVTLGSLCALLLVATATAALFAASAVRKLTQGMSFTGEDDPAYVEWIRLQVTSQVLTMLGPVAATGAGLSFVALLFVLARRWDAREQLRLTVGDYLVDSE